MDKCDNTPVHSTKVPFDPGWNDPPQFSYSAQQTTPNRPRNFLNKRVAFPLSGTGSTPVSSPPANLPPMPVPMVPVVPTLSTQINSRNENEDIEIDSASTLKEVKDILLQFVDSGDLGSKGNEVKKRINVMEDMWSNGKLNKSVQVKMKELAYALRDDQPARADEIHKSLMVDHVSAVCTWMSGVKQLIYHCTARLELLDIDKQESEKCDAE
ncbi:Steroid receptor RNA activator 1 [Papilio machaon]|uniref:Steroid receptor RNA activator 1 n=1 Tax=Papilio machaon TaxID=76193 RepID=A0A194R8E1_PAPMA|nr:Steroid receptor RNA activator 1 [Papilio machaon]